MGSLGGQRARAGFMVAGAGWGTVGRREKGLVRGWSGERVALFSNDEYCTYLRVFPNEE